MSLTDQEYFKICYYMKLLSINHFIRIFSDLERLENIMKAMWLNKIVLIHNIFDLVRIQMVFFSSIHLMTCVWTSLNTADGGLIASGLSKGEIMKGILNPIDESELVSIYVTSAYYVTTTMTTVGYGDIIPSLYDNPEKNS